MLLASLVFHMEIEFDVRVDELQCCENDPLKGEGHPSLGSTPSHPTLWGSGDMFSRGICSKETLC